ncbi:MAG: nitrite reductase, copper-containing [Alphaproteobacteria bacterium]|nr:nitrite reductase, copper-containing [Alphaproteobacteria bacterium]
MILLEGAAIGAALALYAFARPAEGAADAAAPADQATAQTVSDIVRDPADLPPPIDRRSARQVVVNLETSEVLGQLADGTTYHYWTFNKKVPGPFIRVRVGDTVEVHLTNDASSMMMHNVDFHAVTGPGGGAKATLAAPGETKSFTFKAIKPGIFVYHCATPMVAEHIANGMYGMILVEPEKGLPKVDHEYYVMQGEIYTNEPFGSRGEATESFEKLLDEKPEYYVFNGAADALKTKKLHAKTGETTRIFFGVGGPNKTSSFHVIGEMFDKVYPLGSLTSKTVDDVQTVSVPPGGAVAVELKTEVPGDYILVDHALSRMERGLAGILEVKGQTNPEIFKANADIALADH